MQRFGIASRPASQPWSHACGVSCARRHAACSRSVHVRTCPCPHPQGGFRGLGPPSPLLAQGVEGPNVGLRRLLRVEPKVRLPNSRLHPFSWRSVRLCVDVASENPLTHGASMRTFLACCVALLTLVLL